MFSPLKNVVFSHYETVLLHIYFYWTIFSTFSPLCNSESRANNEMTEQKMAPSTTGMPIVEMATVESKESKLRILFLGPPFYFTVDVGS